MKKRIYILHRVGVKHSSVQESVQGASLPQPEDTLVRQERLMAAENGWLGRWLRYRVDPDHFCLYPQLPEDEGDLTDFDGWYEDGRDGDEY